MNTCYVLNQAAACLSVPDTKVYMDSGVENLNKDVDRLLEEGTLERVIAQIDVTFSSSMIESWWRSLKYGWLFINHLDNTSTLRKLIEFCVVEHNIEQRLSEYFHIVARPGACCLARIRLR